MSLPDLPLEVWERVLLLTDSSTQWLLRDTCRAFRRHIQDRCIPLRLAQQAYTIPEASILMFNGFHSYRSDMRLHCQGHVLQPNPKADLRLLYARFALTKPLRNFRINRVDDVEAPLRIHRPCQDVMCLDGRGKPLEEAMVLPKLEMKRQVLVSEDGQALLVPISLLWLTEFELWIPPPKEPEGWGNVGQVHLFGVPSQDWRSTFLSGANQPI